MSFKACVKKYFNLSTGRLFKDVLTSIKPEMKYHKKRIHLLLETILISYSNLNRK